MTSIDLRSLHLRTGDVWRETLELELEPFVFGGERYEPPKAVPAEVEVSEISGGTVLRLSFGVTLSGRCMRCLGDAALEVGVAAREVHDPSAGPGEEPRSEYVRDTRLDVSAWARDAIALELPAQILCRPDCAGLCPVCGQDLNVEPHGHVEQDLDPRWAALESLRDEL